MELLGKVASFGAPIQDFKSIYILFIRSHLEQSAKVWHTTLTQEKKDDMEKSALKIILQERYESYRKALAQLQIETLENKSEEH